jgi:long-chain acyl-CoA synthetase
MQNGEQPCTSNSANRDDDFGHLDYLRDPFSHLDAVQRQWLRPLGFLGRWCQRRLYDANRIVMRSFFRLDASGDSHLPLQSPFILTPNHTSSLDAPAIAAAMEYDMLSHTRWAGRKGAVLRNPIRKSINRLAQTVPVDRDSSALAVAAAVLQRGENLVWFPEGTRTTDGRLQEFQPGIGILMFYLSVPAVPVWIDGAYEALPPHHKLPRWRSPIHVRFGPPLLPETIIDHNDNVTSQVKLLVRTLQGRVASLAQDGFTARDGF